MNSILENLNAKLNACGIHSLRQLGRAVGVYSPTNKKKEELICDILAIASNRAAPQTNDSRRGAPPKSGEYDKALLAEVERCRHICAGLDEGGDAAAYSSVASPADEGEPQMLSGILQSSEKYWLICPEEGGEAYVPSGFVNRFRLREGDKLVCAVRLREEGAVVTAIISVNGIQPEDLERVPFENLTPCYPVERITLEYEGCSLTERLIDLFAPIGKGQRALISSPKKAGCTTLLKHIAGAIEKNHPEISLVAVLIDGRPEDATDFRRSLSGASVVCSPFDRSPSEHVRSAALSLEHAKRLVESGRDVVLILDGITSLIRAYASSEGGAKLSAADAVMQVKRFFGAARNTEESGSLTIIACLSSDGEDRIISEEFRAVCNMEISLSKELALAGIFPAIDLLASSTRKAEALLTEGECAAASAIRSALSEGADVRDIYKAVSSAADNSFLARSFGDILKDIKKDDR